MALRRTWLRYPPVVVDTLRSERQELVSLPSAGDWLNTFGVKKRVGKSYLWVKNTLNRLGYVPEKRRDGAGRASDFFHPEVVEVLQEIASEFPASGDWVTVNRMTEILGVSYQWISLRVDSLGFDPEIRVMPGYGRPMLHYPPDVVESLRELRDQALNTPLHEDWLTAQKLESLVARGPSWVAKRVRGLDYEIRLDPQGVPRKHYPPETFERLTKISAEEKLIGRRTRGFGMRKAIVDTLAAAGGPLTVPGITHRLPGKPKEKAIYDALLLLERLGTVETSNLQRSAGKRTRWKISQDINI